VKIQIKSAKNHLDEFGSALKKLYEQKSLSELDSATKAVQSSYQPM
jgi:hypothetical protein